MIPSSISPSLHSHRYDCNRPINAARYGATDTMLTLSQLGALAHWTMRRAQQGKSRSSSCFLQHRLRMELRMRRAGACARCAPRLLCIPEPLALQITLRLGGSTQRPPTRARRPSPGCRAMSCLDRATLSMRSTRLTSADSGQTLPFQLLFRPRARGPAVRVHVNSTYRCHTLHLPPSSVLLPPLFFGLLLLPL